jgi:hypothetical protein
MIVLDDQISHAGTIGDRARQAIDLMKKCDTNEAGHFIHNETILHVYRDSTVREITYQYEYKLLQRKHEQPVER